MKVCPRMPYFKTYFVNTVICFSFQGVGNIFVGQGIDRR